jgi:glycosyltransferase involved in cell wall biosynthesis
VTAPPLDIVFVVRSMARGGAEGQLARLAVGLAQRGWRVGVATFYAGHVHEATLLAGGVTLLPLHKRRAADLVTPALRLRRLLRESGARVAYSFLTDANVLAAIAGVGRSRPSLIWGIRAAHMDLRLYGPVARISFALSRLLARRADRLICNSSAGAAYHVARGYPADRVAVVPNGFDTIVFRPDPAAGAACRAALGIDPAADVVGVFARFDPMKDHATLLHAFAILRGRRPSAQLLVVGHGSEPAVDHLRSVAAALGVADAVHWIGETADVPRYMNACDVTALSSLGEGLPNAVGESMACGIPCVVTDVGDAREIVGDPRLVVPTAQPAPMAAAIDFALAHRAALSPRLRERIVTDYGIDAMIERTEQLLSPWLGHAEATSSS